MTFIEKFNQRFPNEEAFMRAVEAFGPLDEIKDDYSNISPRGSIPAGCLAMAMRMRANAAMREGPPLRGAPLVAMKKKK